jgi:flagellar basal-body rod modification protein FlgD
MSAAAGTATQTPSAPNGSVQSGSPNGSTAPDQKSFSEVWNQIQAKFGGKEEKPKENKKALDKDDFLKIMVTQLKHQDPTKPMEADKMAAEMAQMTSVEQMHNVNSNLVKMLDQYKANDRVAMTGMIGKWVTVDRNRFDHMERERETLSYTLKEPASSVKLTIISDTGETVLEKDLGPQKSGENSFLWDGKKGNTIAAKAGGYQYHIEAKGKDGQPLQSDTMARAQVVGVNFDGGEASLLVGNPKQPSKVTMRNVTKIESDVQGGVFQAPLPATTGSGNQMFTFKKGEGSKSLDQSALSPEAQAAVEKVVAQKEAEKNPAGNPMEQAALAANSLEKGFPSGLQGDQ